MRGVWALVGFAALGLAFAGLVLPLLPSVPFLLVAAFCFARSSPRMHAWLLDHPKFGPPIRAWERNGAIGRRMKVVAIVSMAASIGLAAWLEFGTAVLVSQAVILSGVAAFIMTRPDR